MPGAPGPPADLLALPARLTACKEGSTAGSADVDIQRRHMFASATSCCQTLRGGILKHTEGPSKDGKLHRVAEADAL
jgi:hypothetical protein